MRAVRAPSADPGELLLGAAGGAMDPRFGIGKGEGTRDEGGEVLGGVAGRRQARAGRGSVGAECGRDQQAAVGNGAGGQVDVRRLVPAR